MSIMEKGRCHFGGIFSIDEMRENILLYIYDEVTHSMLILNFPLNPRDRNKLFVVFFNHSQLQCSELCSWSSFPSAAVLMVN